MRAAVLMLLSAGIAFGQAPPAATPAPTAAAPPAPATAAAAPVVEGPLTGWMEAGYRWQTGVGGSEETYRSVVNLGSGLKLTGLDLTLRVPQQSYFDYIHVQAYDWPDPYSTLRLEAAKRGFYRFTASYRSLAYFNNLPSYADPLLARGIVLDEQSFDARRRLGSLDLQLLPSRTVSPYLALETDSDNGHGVNTFVSGGNEYPVPYTNTNRTRTLRAGVHLTVARWHLTLEEGRTSYRENEDSYAQGLNDGNATGPVLGETLDLTGLARAYGVRGATTYTKANVTGTPVRWLELQGRFLYGEGRNTVNYTQYDTGNLLGLAQVLFFNGESLMEKAEAKMPHTIAELGGDVRARWGFQIRQSWGTDRLHDAGSAAPLTALLVNNYSHADTDILWNKGTHLFLRGGYSHVWGDATDVVLPQAGLTTQTTGQLHRNVLSVGGAWKSGDRLLISGDYSHGFSSGTYFRTSLYDYNKTRLIARYQLVKDVRLHFDYTVIGNHNPLAGSPYSYLTHQESLTVEWSVPESNVMMDITYEHCGYHTTLTYIDPTDFTPSISRYGENCHTVSAAITGTLPRHLSLKAGGAALVTSGSRPTSSYRPFARVDAPVAHNLSWFTEWRYYGLGESYYQYENFRSHLFTTGVRLTR